MKLTKKHVGQRVRIIPEMLAGVWRRCYSNQFGHVGAGGCGLTWDAIQGTAEIASLADDRKRVLIHWTEQGQSIWLDADLIEKA